MASFSISKWVAILSLPFLLSGCLFFDSSSDNNTVNNGLDNNGVVVNNGVEPNNGVPNNGVEPNNGFPNNGIEPNNGVDPNNGIEPNNGELLTPFEVIESCSNDGEQVLDFDLARLGRGKFALIRGYAARVEIDLFDDMGVHISCGTIPVPGFFTSIASFDDEIVIGTSDKAMICNLDAKNCSVPDLNLDDATEVHVSASMIAKSYLVRLGEAGIRRLYVPNAVAGRVEGEVFEGSSFVNLRAPAPFAMSAWRVADDVLYVFGAPEGRDKCEGLPAGTESARFFRQAAALQIIYLDKDGTYKLRDCGSNTPFDPSFHPDEPFEFFEINRISLTEMIIASYGDDLLFIDRLGSQANAVEIGPVDLPNAVKIRVVSSVDQFFVAALVNDEVRIWTEGY